MSKKEKNEDLQSRRQFFKKAAKSALPVLGAIILANAPVIAQATEPATYCKYGCQHACEGCKYTCSGTCKNACEGCRYGCQGTCKNACEGCRYGCQGTCKNTCSGSCRTSSSR